MSSEVIRLEPDAFLALLEDSSASESLSVMQGVAMVEVDLRGGVDSAPPSADHVARYSLLPTVVAAIVGDTPSASVARWVDLVADVTVAHDTLALIPVVTNTPLASASLALRLRDSTQSTAHGLVLESAVYSMLQAGPEFTRWRATTPRRERVEPIEPVRWNVEERVDHNALVITLNRPHVHNAINAAIRDGLTEALAIAERDASLRVELRGNGPSLCSGGDLDEFGSFLNPVQSHVTRLTRSPAAMFSRLNTRITSFAHGSCMGGGIEIPAFGRITAQRAARFALPEVRYGLIPGAGGTVSIPKRIGRHRTAWLALSGQAIDATTAFAWGLIDEVAVDE